MEELRVIIAGGRDFTNYAFLAEKVTHTLSNFATSRKIIILSGKAKGADSLGEQYAHAMNYNIVEFPADWSVGRSAGYLRNKQMAENADACICFWDGQSRGTKSMIALAESHGLMLKIYRY